ncbi:MAG: hypothetical protein QJR03_09990 [Sphaerobacter sp.]|nr:hypothetical protein [Sphaerobacter sp.]
MSGEDPGRAALRSGATLRQVVTWAGRREAVSLEPGCAFGAVTRAQVDELAAELREIKGRLNQLFTLVVGSIAVDVLLRLAGLG